MNTTKFQQSIETAKAKAANDPKWLSAIERAATGILAGDICVSLFANGEALVTTPNNSYVVNGHCTCKAASNGHRECYHRAAKRLAELMDTASVEAPAVSREDERAKLITEIENIWPTFAPGLPLYNELLARFGVSSLKMLDDDILRRVRLAVSM